MPLLFHTAGPFSHHLYPSIPFSLPLSLSFTRSLCSPLLHVTSPLSFRFFISFVMPVFACPLLFAFLFVHFSPAPYILFFVKLSSFFHPTLSHNFSFIQSLQVLFFRSYFLSSASSHLVSLLLTLAPLLFHVLPSLQLSSFQSSFFARIPSLPIVLPPFVLSLNPLFLPFYLFFISVFLSPHFSFFLSFSLFLRFSPFLYFCLSFPSFLSFSLSFSVFCEGVSDWE